MRKRGGSNPSEGTKGIKMKNLKWLIVVPVKAIILIMFLLTVLMTVVSDVVAQAWLWFVYLLLDLCDKLEGS